MKEYHYTMYYYAASNNIKYNRIPIETNNGRWLDT